MKRSGINNHGLPNSRTMTPGEALRRLFMDPLGISPYRLSKELGVPPTAISQILRDKRSISPAMAMRLGFYFDVHPKAFMDLQVLHDLRLSSEKMNNPNEGHAVQRCSLLDGKKIVFISTAKHVHDGISHRYAEQLTEVQVVSKRPKPKVTATNKKPLASNSV